MATVTATTWMKGYWDSTANALNRQMDNFMNQLLNVFEGCELDTVTDSYATGWLYSGGSFTVYGSNIGQSGETISRIIINGVGWSMDLQCNLREGNYTDVVGSISSIDFTGSGTSLSIRGNMRISEYGVMYAYNTTEQITFSNGLTLNSETNASGDYVKHTLSLAGNTITVQGNWDYESVDDWRDLLSGTDTLNGTTGNDYLNGYAGNDTLLGGLGTDTAVLNGFKSNYTLTKTATGLVVKANSGTDGTDTLTNIERLQFLDQTLAFDLDGNAGQIYRLYQAALNRTPDKVGLGSWIEGMDNGLKLTQAASGFINSAEFQSKYGSNPTNSQFVDLLYENVLHRDPDTAGFDYWTGELARGLSREQVLTGFSESTENKLSLMAFDMDGHMGQVYRLYKAALNRAPDATGLESWTNGVDNGMTLSQVASGFINSAEFQSRYGSNPTNAQFVDLLYENVLNRDPDTAGYNAWMNGLATGLSREEALIGFSESLENKLALVGIVQDGIQFV